MDVKKYLQATSASKHWGKIGIRHHHGVCFPLFSIRTEEGGGIGEYLDLISCIDWLKSIDFNVLQLLPINDTHGRSSPYSPVSAFALNPIYLSLISLTRASQTKKRERLLKELSDLNRLPRVDYASVHQLKEEFLDDYYETEWELYAQNSDFLEFIKNNSWLESYTLFKALAYSSGTLSWSQWKEEWKNPGDNWGKLLDEHRCQIQRSQLVQFLCFKQMTEVRQYADARGVLIKGDCPILISLESADVWSQRHLFHLELSAGAPPDYYNSEGQDWEVPVYNWPAMEAENFKWWKQRLQAVESIYHLYRLDHVVGFYRIWVCKTDGEQKSCGFLPADPSVWIPHGEKILKMLLDSSHLLPIGEDLGTVPDEVKSSLKKLGICGTKVLRWEKTEEPPYIFTSFDQYEPVSMTTVSTHDTETLVGWWRSHHKEVKSFISFMGWQEEEKLTFEHHLEILKASHSTPSLFHINLINEYLALFDTMVSSDPSEERINTPGTLSDKNWTYRMKMTVHQMSEDQKLTKVMKILSV